jgi:hypothetical protein
LRISWWKRRALHGHVLGTPFASRYQLLQPVTHTVSFMAPRSRSWNARVASAVGASARTSPFRSRRMHFMM